ncbi:MAG: cytochrome c [Gammaproteobacteria bacterium]|nr:cytochrome c [Gammaproteobacteria bacterium]
MRQQDLLGSLLIILVLVPSGVGAVNPKSEQHDRIAQGQALFKSDCAACHGVTAKGDGPLAHELKIPPPNLTALSHRNGGEFPADYVYRVIDGRDLPRAHGSSDMPVWGDVYKPAPPSYGERRVHDRLTTLVQYLKSLQVE